MVEIPFYLYIYASFRSRSRLDEVTRWQASLEELWKSSRWMLNLISFARDKNAARGALTLRVLRSPTASPSTSRKDVPGVVAVAATSGGGVGAVDSSCCSDMGYHSDMSLGGSGNSSSTLASEEDGVDVWRRRAGTTPEDARHAPASAVLRVYAAYRSCLAAGSSVKLHVGARTSSRQVVRLVVEQLNRAARETATPLAPQTQTPADFVLVAVIGARERVLRDDYPPLELQNPWTKGRLYVRHRRDTLAALEQGHVTSV